jgi:hypothetical protein
MAKAKSRGATKAAEGANKRDGETISTSSESSAHVNRKARVETNENVVSPQGKEKTPTAEDEAMEESGKEAETGATVSLEDEVGKAKEMEIAARKKENDKDKNKDQENSEQEKENVDATDVDNEEDYNMQTANEEIEVEDITKAHANKEGKRSIEELNKGLKSNIIYKWPERTKFIQTQLSKKIGNVMWKKTKALTTLKPDEDPTAGKSLMVAVAEYDDAWKGNFQGEELNDKTVTKIKGKGTNDGISIRKTCQRPQGQETKSG